MDILSTMSDETLRGVAELALVVAHLLTGEIIKKVLFDTSCWFMFQGLPLTFLIGTS